MAQIDPKSFWHHPGVQAIQRLAYLHGELRSLGKEGEGLALVLSEDRKKLFEIDQPHDPKGMGEHLIPIFRFILKSLTSMETPVEQIHDYYQGEQAKRSANPQSFKDFLTDMRRVIYWMAASLLATEKAFIAKAADKAREALFRKQFQDIRGELQSITHEAQRVYKTLDHKIWNLLVGIHLVGAKEGSETIAAQAKHINTAKEAIQGELSELIEQYQSNEGKGVPDLGRVAAACIKKWSQLEDAYRRSNDVLKHLYTDLKTFSEATDQGVVSRDDETIVEHIQLWADIHSESTDMLQGLAEDRDAIHERMGPLERLHAALFFSVKGEEDLLLDTGKGANFEAQIMEKAHEAEEIIQQVQGDIQVIEERVKKFQGEVQDWDFRKRFVTVLCALAQLHRYRILVSWVEKERAYEEEVRENALYRRMQSNKEIQKLLEQRKEIEEKRKGLKGTFKAWIGDGDKAKDEETLRKIAESLAEWKAKGEAANNVLKQPLVDFGPLQEKTASTRWEIESVQKRFQVVCSSLIRNDGSFVMEIALPDLFSEKAGNSSPEEPFGDHSTVPVRGKGDVMQMKGAYTRYLETLNRSHEMLTTTKPQGRGSPGAQEESWGIGMTLDREKSIAATLLKKDLCSGLNSGQILPQDTPRKAAAVLGVKLYKLITEGRVKVGTLTPEMLDLLATEEQEIKKKLQKMDQDISFLRAKRAKLRGTQAPTGMSMKDKLDRNIRQREHSKVNFLELIAERDRILIDP